MPGCALPVAVLSFLTPRFRRPMSLVSSVFGSDDDGEILDALYTIANASQILSSPRNDQLTYHSRIPLDLA